jgi:hypothetical protein
MGYRWDGENDDASRNQDCGGNVLGCRVGYDYNCRNAHSGD